MRGGRPASSEWGEGLLGRGGPSAEDEDDEGSMITRLDWGMVGVEEIPKGKKAVKPVLGQCLGEVALVDLLHALQGIPGNTGVTSYNTTVILGGHVQEIHDVEDEE